MREAMLQLGAHRRIVANEVARDQQQIEEVEPPRAALEVLVNADYRPQLVAQQRREVRARVVAKFLQPLMQRGAPPENLVTLDLAKAATVSLPVPMPARAKSDQHGFERVIVAPAHRFQPRRLVYRLGDILEALRQPILVLAELAKFAERFDFRDYRVDFGIARERRMLPGRIEVAPVHQLERRVPCDLTRPGARRQIAPPQQPPHALARLVEDTLEPSLERRVEHLVRNVFGRDFEHRIDARLNRPLAQQVGTKRMNRP